MSRSLPAVFGEVEIIDNLREPLQFRIGSDDIVGDADMLERFQTALLLLDATSTWAGGISAVFCFRNLCWGYYYTHVTLSKSIIVFRRLFLETNLSGGHFYALWQFGCKAKMNQGASDILNVSRYRIAISGISSCHSEMW